MPDWARGCCRFGACGEDSFGGAVGPVSGCGGLPFAQAASSRARSCLSASPSTPWAARVGTARSWPATHPSSPQQRTDRGHDHRERRSRNQIRPRTSPRTSGTRPEVNPFEPARDRGVYVSGQAVAHLTLQSSSANGVRHTIAAARRPPVTGMTSTRSRPAWDKLTRSVNIGQRCVDPPVGRRRFPCATTPPTGRRKDRLPHEFKHGRPLGSTRTG